LFQLEEEGNDEDADLMPNAERQEAIFAVLTIKNKLQDTRKDTEDSIKMHQKNLKSIKDEELRTQETLDALGYVAP
jgi:Holliday junction resolvasome RuvABC DNA-binding subunit